jgi:hypothetical protein
VKVLLIGSGAESNNARHILNWGGHTVIAQHRVLVPDHLDMFGYDLLVAVIPEATVQIPTLNSAVEKGTEVILISSAEFTAWAATISHVPSFSYPLDGGKESFVKALQEADQRVQRNAATTVVVDDKKQTEEIQ